MHKEIIKQISLFVIDLTNIPHPKLTLLVELLLLCNTTQTNGLKFHLVSLVAEKYRNCSFKCHIHKKRSMFIDFYKFKIMINTLKINDTYFRSAIFNISHKFFFLLSKIKYIEIIQLLFIQVIAFERVAPRVT